MQCCAAYRTHASVHLDFSVLIRRELSFSWYHLPSERFCLNPFGSCIWWKHEGSESTMKSASVKMRSFAVLLVLFCSHQHRFSLVMSYPRRYHLSCCFMICVAIPCHHAKICIQLRAICHVGMRCLQQEWRRDEKSGCRVCSKTSFLNCVEHPLDVCSQATASTLCCWFPSWLCQWSKRQRSGKAHHPPGCLTARRSAETSANWGRKQSTSKLFWNPHSLIILYTVYNYNYTIRIDMTCPYPYCSCQQTTIAPSRSHLWVSVVS